jgi:hypothetical protein
VGQRVYSTYFENVTIAAVQDVFSIKAGAANGVELHQITLGAGGVTGAAEIRLVLKRLPATVTVGTGGTAPTISPTDSGDTKTATAAVRANDITTQATTSGTPATLLAWQWNVLGPFDYLPAPEDREVIQASEALVLNIPGTPASTVVSGFIKWREVP